MIEMLYPSPVDGKAQAVSVDQVHCLERWLHLMKRDFVVLEATSATSRQCGFGREKSWRRVGRRG
jgi:hypothetical protein